MLMEARGDTSRLREEMSELQTRAERHHREHKHLLEMIERKGFLTGRSSVPIVRPKATDVERRTLAHLT